MTLEYLLDNHKEIKDMYDMYIKQHRENYYSNIEPKTIWEFIEDLEQCESEKCQKWTNDVEQTNGHGRMCESCRNDL